MAKYDCQVCTHPEVLSINQALYRGGSTREVAKRFGFRDNKAIWRHKQKHLPDEIAQAVLQATIATEARVREALQPKIVLDALWELYRRLGSCCRPQALAIIESLEREYELPDGVERSHPRTGPGSLDRPLYPTE